MFEEWKRAWRDAVANFWRELDDAGPGVGSERIAAMRRDARAARAELDRVAEELNRARAQFAEERKAEEDCRRREGLARRIGDEETARIAAEYAARHAERAAVLEAKVRAIEAELAMRRRDVEEMEAALRQLEAATGPGGAAHGPGGAVDGGGGAGVFEDDAISPEFRRMERAAREREAERRLEELKRRMSRS